MTRYFRVSRGAVALVLTILLLVGCLSIAYAAVTVIGTIPVGKHPTWVSVDPSTNLVYVANYASGTVSIIDGASNQVIKSIATGQEPRSVALNLTTRLGYVTNYASNTISIISLSTNEIVGAMPIQSPWHASINPTTNRAYVSSRKAMQVEVVDLNTNQLIASLPTSRHNLDAVVDPATNLVYVGVAEPAEVLVFDGNTNQQINKVFLSNAASFPDRMLLNSLTHRLYVSVQLHDHQVAVIDTTTNTEIAKIPTGGVPDGLALDPTTNQLYIGSVNQLGPDTLLQVDGNTNQVVASTLPGTQPIGLGINTVTHRLYSANFKDNAVAVVSLDGS